MAQTTISIRMDEELKEQTEELYRKMGTSFRNVLEKMRDWEQSVMSLFQ